MKKKNNINFNLRLISSMGICVTSCRWHGNTCKQTQFCCFLITGDHWSSIASWGGAVTPSSWRWCLASACVRGGGPRRRRWSCSSHSSSLHKVSKPNPELLLDPIRISRGLKEMDRKWVWLSELIKFKWCEIIVIFTVVWWWIVCWSLMVVT